MKEQTCNGESYVLQYHHHAVIEGAEVREVSLKDGIHDLDAMLEHVDDKTKIVWICNPNNPNRYICLRNKNYFYFRISS